MYCGTIQLSDNTTYFETEIYHFRVFALGTYHELLKTYLQIQTMDDMFHFAKRPVCRVYWEIYCLNRTVLPPGGIFM